MSLLGKRLRTEEEDGLIDESKCLARVWVGGGNGSGPRSRFSKYDNMQCPFKKVDGCGCFCKVHYAKDLACKEIDGLDGWYLGVVTEEKPESIIQPSGWDKVEKKYSGTVSHNGQVWTSSKKKKTYQEFKEVRMIERWNGDFYELIPVASS